MTVFEFSDFKEFIRFKISGQLYNSAGRKKSNLSRIAQSLGYSSRSLLSMVLSGKRLPSPELCEALFTSWNLPRKEREYFRLLVQLERKKRLGQDITQIEEQLRKMSSNRDIYNLKPAEFSLLREWYFYVIKELVDAPDFEEDPQWISRRLRRKVTPTQAQRALEKMLEAGVLVRDPGTGRLQSPTPMTETTHDIPSSDIRQHQKEMMSRAAEAIDERDVNERFFNTLTLRIDPSRIQDVREYLLECVRWVNAEFSSASAAGVYQLNIQFFEHTVAGAKLAQREISSETH
jgi:uncharacterized protein (TIGR02147 family)